MYSILSNPRQKDTRKSLKTLHSWSTLLFAGTVSAQISITPLEGNSEFVENERKRYLYSNTANIIVALDTSDIYEQISTIVLYKSTLDSRATSKAYAEELDGL